jgi:hypothetical protein
MNHEEIHDANDRFLKDATETKDMVFFSRANIEKLIREGTITVNLNKEQRVDMDEVTRRGFYAGDLHQLSLYPHMLIGCETQAGTGIICIVPEKKYRTDWAG